MNRSTASEAGERPLTPRPRRNLAESPLVWLHSRKDRSGQPIITVAQLEAGERFRADFTFAGLQPHVTANWSPAARGNDGPRGTPGFGRELSDNIIAAKQRVSQALSAVGPELSGILIDVCGLLNGVEVAERRLGLPQRSGKVVLQFALTSLARHYGILPAAPSPIRHWGEDGYRPTLDAWTRESAASR